MGKNHEFDSANNWLERAGACIRNNKPIMPHLFLTVPMNAASEAVEIYNNDDSYNSRLKAVQTIALNVRTAETAFFKRIAKILKEVNKQLGIEICHYCIRNHMFGTNFKELRKLANSKIIHRMEEEAMISVEDFQIAIDYYNEMFKLPLVDPITWKETKGIPMCKNCLKKNEKIRNKQ